MAESRLLALVPLALTFLLVACVSASGGQTPPEVTELFSATGALRDDGPASAGLTVAGLEFDPATRDSARAFLNEYLAYCEAVEAQVQSKLRDCGRSYDRLNSVRRSVVARYQKSYKRAMRLAAAHLADFDSGLGDSLDPGLTSLLIQKSTFLILLADSRGSRACAAFPMAFGINPDSGPKVDRGDLRTPESPDGARSSDATPFFASPLVEGDPYPEGGCIARGIGVSSDDPEYAFLEDGWTVMLHGTPDRGCMGTRASHGCIRLMPEHIRVLFRHVREGTRIVIVP